jgi:hypothetical protein
MQNIILTPVAVPELVNLIACEIEARWIKKDFSTHKTAENKSQKLYSIQDLADFLQISATTAQKYKNEGLPCIQYGRKVVFDADEVLSWLKGKSIRKNFKKDAFISQDKMNKVFEHR